LYPSEEAFHVSPLYGGGDAVIDDPHAEFAVWPGKTNADRHPDDWWTMSGFAGCATNRGPVIPCSTAIIRHFGSAGPWKPPAERTAA
jgi:hypothetical protein